MTRWTGAAPTSCDVCHEEIDDVFYDVSIPMAGGSWGNVCPRCFKECGCNLGVGSGQKYRQQEDGTYVCVEGGRDARKSAPLKKGPHNSDAGGST